MEVRMKMYSGSEWPIIRAATSRSWLRIEEQKMCLLHACLEDNNNIIGEVVTLVTAAGRASFLVGVTILLSEPNLR